MELSVGCIGSFDTVRACRTHHRMIVPFSQLHNAYNRLSVKMTFDTTWDVDKYRTEHEYEDHWQFRRKFLVAHKDKFCEDRLVCLAQVFFNVEFLGCRYPKETMNLIESLSEDLAGDLREQRKGKLQRTFVGAKDAAEAKAKR